MKKLFFTMAVAVAFSFTSCKDKAADNTPVSDAQSATSAAATMATTDASSQTSTAVDGKFPVMTFEKTEHDFGSIAQGTNVEHLFTFTNTGEAPLIISDARGSCGCTVPQFTKDPILPGQQGEMLVKFNGTGQNQRTISVNITTNTQRVTERVTIKAFVEPTNS